MTVLDIFYAVIVVSSILGLLLLSVSYVAITGINLVTNATANLPTYTPQSFSTSLSSVVGMLPTFAVIFVLVLCFQPVHFSLVLGAHG